MKLKAYNLRSPNGNFVPNQIKIVEIKKDYIKETFQSYDTTICSIEYKDNKRKILLDTYALGYSRTTSKYLYKFMYMNRKEIERLIKQNEIKFTNLNKRDEKFN